MRFKAFSEVCEYLDSFSYKDKSLTPGILRGARLERMSALLAHIGNPEKSFKSVHLAGSKGKGSTALYISKVLESCGYRTGLYLSPHLTDYRERFTLCGTFFPDDFLISTAEKLANALDGFTLADLVSPYPSTFELYTAYAYLLFQEAGCEYAVIEAGIGGRLDATNTIDSFAQILLPVELEHTNVLGGTIREIAIEKSKIIKPSSLVFSSFQKSEAMDVLREEAEAQGATFITLADEILSLDTRTTEEGERARILFKDGALYELVLRMRGEVQAANAALALLFARRTGFLREGSVKAIEEAVLPGRFEHFRYEDCDIILDVAHTKSSMTHTVSSFQALYGKRRRACIFSCIDGKDTRSMLSVLLSSFDNIIISRPGSFKKSDPTALFSLAKEMGDDQTILLKEDEREALESARDNAGEGGAILICGSFYLASLFKELLDGYQCK